MGQNSREAMYWQLSKKEMAGLLISLKNRGCNKPKVMKKRGCGKPSL
jgi:hypothetical protein